MFISTKCNNVFWKNIYPYSFRRLNIIDMAPVNQTFYENMDCLGSVELDHLRNKVFDESEWKSLKWCFSNINIVCSPLVFLFHVKIKQHLRRGYKLAFHQEEWIFGLFKGNNKHLYLCPLKMLSDFDNEIIPMLLSMSQIPSSFPWKRHSSIY